MDWTYYKSGGVKTLKYPSQGTRETVTYTYDARTQRPATLTTSAFTAPIVAAASWTTQGAPDAQTWGDATSSDKINVDWIYDSDTLRLSSLKAGKNTYTGNIQHLVYDYDRNSNITSILDKQNSDQYQCFTYDWLNRLESAYTDDDCAGSVVATGDGNYDDDFDYDSLGNVKPVGEGYVYGAGPAGPHAVTSANGWTFTYDSNGNQATRVHPGGSRTDTLTFDVNNRLTNYEVDSGGLAADTGFVYDADGSRIAVITDSGDVTHYIAGIHTHDVAAGTEENSYTFSGVTVGLNDDGVRHHVFTDHLATVTGTLAYGLAVANVERLRYSPYGDKRGSTGTVAGDRTYTGQVDDMTLTGLMFYNARYYDPAARNFVSPDTIIPDPASTLGWNRYSYVNNNPINANDPTGHCTTSNGTLIDGGDETPCSVLPPVEADGCPVGTSYYEGHGCGWVSFNEIRFDLPMSDYEFSLCVQKGWLACHATTRYERAMDFANNEYGLAVAAMVDKVESLTVDEKKDLARRIIARNVLSGGACSLTSDHLGFVNPGRCGH